MSRGAWGEGTIMSKRVTFYPFGNGFYAQKRGPAAGNNGEADLSTCQSRYTQTELGALVRLLIIWNTLTSELTPLLFKSQFHE